MKQHRHDPQVPASAVRSCLFECTLMHHRRSPVEHRFSYRIAMACLDLDEIEALAASCRLFSHNGRNLYSVHDADHLPGGSGSLKQSCLTLLRREVPELSDASRIRLLTLPRVLGYVFNPVSFYFCDDPVTGLSCALAEVGNTFGEVKHYLVPAAGSAGGYFRARLPKHFYVSPFSELDVEFDFRLRAPGETVRVSVDDYKQSERTLISALAGVRRPFTDRTLAWFLVKYPFITARVMLLIHWHAARLWLKQAPWHRKAEAPDLQRGVLRPHHSPTQH